MSRSIKMSKKIRVGSNRFKIYKNGNIATQRRTSKSTWKTIQVCKVPRKSK